MSAEVSTTTAVIVCVGAVLILVAVGLAVPGWLTRRPDGAARFRLRFLSWLALLLGWFLIHDGTVHGWWQWALYLTMTVAFWSRVSHWYGASEKARKEEAEQARLVAALKSGRPMWLPNDYRGGM